MNDHSTNLVVGRNVLAPKGQEGTVVDRVVSEGGSVRYVVAITSKNPTSPDHRGFPLCLFSPTELVLL